MGDRPGNPWHVREVDDETVERLAVTIEPYPGAVEKGVDIVGDPHREDDDGYNWSRHVPGQGGRLGLRGQ